MSRNRPLIDAIKHGNIDSTGLNAKDSKHVFTQLSIEIAPKTGSGDTVLINATLALYGVVDTDVVYTSSDAVSCLAKYQQFLPFSFFSCLLL